MKVMIWIIIIQIRKMVLLDYSAIAMKPLPLTIFRSSLGAEVAH